MGIRALSKLMLSLLFMPMTNQPNNDTSMTMRLPWSWMTTLIGQQGG
jgi:hypothetical protein